MANSQELSPILRCMHRRCSLGWFGCVLWSYVLCCAADSLWVCLDRSCVRATNAVVAAVEQHLSLSSAPLPLKASQFTPYPRTGRLLGAVWVHGVCRSSRFFGSKHRL